MTESEKYFDYLQMLRKPFQKLCRLRFLQPDGSTAFMLDNRRDGARAGAFIADGTITHNWQNGRRTNVTVTIDNTDGEYDYNFNTVWFGQEIALDEGLILSDGETEFYIQQGVFLIEEPSENVKPGTRTVTYNLVDKVAELDGALGGNLEGTYQVEAGTNIFEPIAELLAEDRGNGYPIDRVTPVFTEYYNNMTQELPDGTIAHMTDAPYTLTVEGGQSKWNVIEGLAAMVNAWVGYDETGALRLDPSQDDILDKEKPVEWEFSTDEAELLGMTYTDKNTEVYNDYIVVGELLSDNSQPTGRAQIFDSRSPVSIDAIGRKTIRVSMAGYGTNTQCRDYANFMIKRSSISRSAVSISCSQIFHIRGNQLITIERTDKTGSPIERHLVQGFSRPLASNGAMTITATSTQDLDYASVASVSTFRFVSSSAFTLETGNSAKNWDGTLEYSYNTINWTPWDGTTTVPSQLVNGDYCIYLRGTGNTVITGAGTTNGFVLTGSQIRCDGNVEILLDNDMANNGLHPPMASSCFSGLFYGNTSIVSAPTLGAEVLSDSCYSNMFNGCTGLTEAPALPATALGASCYYEMFHGCTALAAAPVLPATVMANNCYYGMFMGCTGLATPPSLPAESLAYGCYAGMFLECSSMTDAPVLPAMTLESACYLGMFSGCTALTIPPALPATSLASTCYGIMFDGCTALTETPELPATVLADLCYFQMFYNCTGLTALPELPALELAVNCYNQMFSGCTGIKVSETRVGEYQTPYRIPVTGTGIDATNALSNMFAGTGGTFTGTPVVNTKYYVVGGEAETPYLTFTSPSSFTLSVGNSTKNWDGTIEKSTDAEHWTTWNGTTTLSAASDGIQYYLYLRGSNNTVITGSNQNYRWALTGTNVSCIGDIRMLLDYEDAENATMASYCFYHLFEFCTSLIKAPLFPSETLSSYCYAGTFGGCTSLVTAPDLPATTLANRCYYAMFLNCTALTKAPALPATTLANYCYQQMFSGCTSLVNPPVLQATTLADSCCYYMFLNCTALASAPALSATTLAPRCYSCMFQGCTALTTPPALPATACEQSCYYSMFYNCTSLQTTPTLPATTLALDCYTTMFAGCTSLTTLPALPATTLATECYYAMFSRCSGIKVSQTQTGEYQIPYRIPESGTGTTATSALRNMFSDTGGPFVGTPNINTTYYLYDPNFYLPVMLDYSFSDGQLLFYEADDRCNVCGGTGETECEACGGTGVVEEPCSSCGGTGVVEEVDPETGDVEYVECSACEGTGHFDATCPACGGAGEEQCQECEGTGVGHYGDYEEDAYTFDAQNGILEILQQEEEGEP